MRDITHKERCWAIDTLKRAREDAKGLLNQIEGLTSEVVRAQREIARDLAHPPEDTDGDTFSQAGYASSAQLVRLSQHLAAIRGLWPECAAEYEKGRR